MKNNEVELLWRYIINNLTALEQEVQQLQQNLRYRRIDTIDCHELALAIERLNTFRKVSNDILLLIVWQNWGLEVTKHTTSQLQA